jgi:hypothetical protein
MIQESTTEHEMTTQAQLSRLSRDWNDYAGGEPVRVEKIGGTFYGFTTELGALRLLRKYIETNGVRADFSKNMGSWFFRLEPRF